VSVEVITAGEVAAQEQERKSLVAKFAAKYGLEANKLMSTLKATAFKGEVTNEQMAALLIVADQHGLNPWTKEIYAFPSRNGIVPVVGVDGWARIINEHPQFDGMEFSFDEKAQSYTCTIYRKDRSHPTSITEFMSECARGTDPWKTHPMRMLRHKTMIQCARIAFSFAGIYDPDEAERIVEAVDVTPQHDDDYAPTGKISPKRLRKIVDGLIDCTKREDGPGLLQIWNELESEQQLFVWGELRSWERSAIKKLRDEALAADCGVNLSGWATDVLGGCQDEKALQVAWDAVQQAYDENGVEKVPEPVEKVYQHKLAELHK
jgi:hypothetical protein